MKKQNDSNIVFNISETILEIADRLKNMTSEEFRESLVRAGIITNNGELVMATRKGHGFSTQALIHLEAAGWTPTRVRPCYALF